MAKLCSTYFSSNGSWVCPAGVTKIMVLAHGGGAGGSGGRNAAGTQQIASASTIPYLIQLDVVPNTSYSITIGTGGTGGAPRTTATANGGVGGTTTFGTLWTFLGGFRDGSGGAQTSGYGAVFNDYGMGCVRSTNVSPNFTNGFISTNITFGAASGSYVAGFVGHPGYYGSVGGTGGTANSAGAGGNGGNASGFGASGGQGGAGSTSGGSGGAGAPGQMWVIWVE